MKRWRTWMLLLLAMGGVSAVGQGFGQEQGTVALTALDQAEVRLPYGELRKLWEAAQGRDKPGEVVEVPPGALMGAAYVADLSSGQVMLEAEFRVESFEGKYERIKLVGAELALAKVEPPETTLLVDGTDVFWVAKEPGAKTVRVQFAPLPLPLSGTEPWLKLTMAPSAMVSFRVKGLPEGSTVKVGDKAALAAAKDGTVEVPVAAKGGELSLLLTARQMELETKPLEPPTPSEWGLQNEVLGFEEDGSLQYRVHTQLSAQGGSALEAAMVLPAQVKQLVVTGEDLAEHRSVRREDGRTELRLRWNTRDVMERELRLSYALPQLALAENWELKAPALEVESRVKSIFMFPLLAGVEFGAVNLQGPVLARNLPKWVIAEKAVGEFGTVTGGTAVEVKKKLLPRLETAATLVTKAEFSSRLVGDGSLLTEASFELEHEETARWTLTLPENAALLKCAVNNLPQRPVERGGGMMEIGLGHDGSQTAAKTTVTFSYTEAKGKLDAVEGRVALELPLTPLFINEVIWNVTLPETYSMVAQGNVEQVAGTGPHALRFIKKLCRNERPQVELFYRRKGLD